ncbi:trypsin-like peptidase domain-containing protein [Frankia sp. CiP3]|uniref:trypsin-like peptidase domain-containing protein n=1 Tax=Frankia sp. CiP3 TaxID=2880971 RepID=UPI001EF4FA01|nr:trypsin-like peptidase domain-containing protein [Frankia sp. CiP3]
MGRLLAGGTPDQSMGDEDFRTGFVIAGGFVLTAAHCVQDLDDEPLWLRLLYGAGGQGRRYAFVPVRVVDVDEALDGAVLALDTGRVAARGQDVQGLTGLLARVAVPLGVTVGHGWKIRTEGFPASAANVDGTVFSGTVDDPDGRVHRAGVAAPALQLGLKPLAAAAPESPKGHSGGPVLHEPSSVTGRVGAVAVGMVRSYPPGDEGKGTALGGIVYATRVRDLARRFSPVADAVGSSADVVSPSEWRSHWEPRARGVERAIRPGYFFTGRREALTKIVEWFGSAYDTIDPLRVVTGGPGSGKSAVLARLVTMSNAAYRERSPALLESDPLRLFRPGSIDIAVHARGLAPRTVVERIIAIVNTSEDAPESSSADDQILTDRLVDLLLGRQHPLRIVVDAVDESKEPERLAAALGLLALEAADTGLRLLIGTRKGGPTQRLLVVLGVAGSKSSSSKMNLIDLDRQPYLERSDLTEYIWQRLLQAGVSPVDSLGHTPYRGQSELALDVAKAVCDAAYPSFLIAQLVTRELLNRPEPIYPGDPTLQQFPKNVENALDRYLASLGSPKEQAWVERMLTPLAYAQVDGLPHDSIGIWPELATALAPPGEKYDVADVNRLLDTAADYLVETTVVDEGVYYRLYHQALADHLLKRDHLTARTRSPDTLIFEALVGTVSVDGRGRVRWDQAHPYLQQYLAVHAVAAGELACLVEDADFLAAAEPAGLFLALRSRGDSYNGLNAQIYLAAFHDLPIGRKRAVERAAQLQIAARRYRSALAGRMEAGIFELPLSTRWLVGSPPVPHFVTGRHSNWVDAVAIATIDDRTVAVTGSWDGTVRTWDLATGRPFGAPLYGEIMNGPSSRSMDDRRLDLKTESTVSRMTTIAVTQLGGHTLAITGSHDHSVRLWDLTAGKQLGPPLYGHAARVSAITVSVLDDRPVAMTASWDGSVRMWDLVRRTALGEAIDGHAGPLNAIAVTAVNSRQVAVTGGDDGVIRLWDLADGSAGDEATMGQNCPIRAIATATLDGRPVALTGGDDGAVRIWDLNTRSPLGAPMHGHDLRVRSIATGRLGDRPIAVSSSDDETARIWDLTNRQPMGETLRGHTAPVTGIAITSFDERSIAVTGSRDRTVRVWNLTELARRKDSTEQRVSPASATTTMKIGGQAVVVTGHEDRSIRVWDLENGELLRAAAQDHEGVVVAVAASGDGAVLVSGGDDQTIRSWTVTGTTTTSELLQRFDARVSTLAISHLHGQQVVLAGAGDGSVYLLDASGRHLGQPLTGHVGRVSAVTTFPMDDRIVAATGGDDGTVRLWDVATRSALGAPLTGHTDWVSAIGSGVLANQPIVATGSWDHTIRLWNPATQTSIGPPLEGHSSRVSTVECGTLGGQPIIITGGWDRTIRIWDAHTGAEIHRIRLAAPVRATTLFADALIVATEREILRLDLT